MREDDQRWHDLDYDVYGTPVMPMSGCCLVSLVVAGCLAGWLITEGLLGAVKIILAMVH